MHGPGKVASVFATSVTHSKTPSKRAVRATSPNAPQFPSHPHFVRATTISHGYTVGDHVGLTVGLALGDALGILLGDADGDALGVPLGAALGETLGLALGACDGLVDGDALGETEGLALGLVVGESVGLLGDGVGAGVMTSRSKSPPHT